MDASATSDVPEQKIPLWEFWQLFITKIFVAISTWLKRKGK